MPAFIHTGQLPALFVESLFKSYMAMPNFNFYSANSSSLPNQARTVNGYTFLESDAEWIFLIDTDMVWEPGAIIRLLQTAKQKKAKAVSGLAFMPKGGIWPHAYMKQGYHYEHLATLPDADTFTVDAVGGACFLVHREVYEKVAQLPPDREYLWQEEKYVNGTMRGEDIVFSSRIQEAGYDIWYDQRAVFLHLKQSLLGPKEYLQFQQRLMEHGVLHPPDQGTAAQ
jgi:GT2 family glycosyltransferase